LEKSAGPEQAQGAVSKGWYELNGAPVLSAAKRSRRAAVERLEGFERLEPLLGVERLERFERLERVDLFGES